MVDLRIWLCDKPMTKRAYLEDSYIKETKGVVLDYLCERQSKCYVILDKTIFHPLGGGQPSDVGYLESSELNFEVTKVLEYGDSVVHYGKVLRGELKRNLEVRMFLKWDLRYLVMRLHTAGHVLDYGVMKTCGRVVNTLEAYHGPPEAYVVYDASLPSSEIVLREIEELSNNIINRGIPVKVVWVDRDELYKRAYNAPNLQRLPVRNRYRLIEIEGVNAIPCTGTHVANTIEIGVVKILRIERYPDGFKLFYIVK